MKIIILVLLGLTLTSSIHQSGEKNGRKMSCKSMLSMPEYNQESNEDVNSALLTLESSEHKHYHSFDEPYEPKTHHSNEDVMINKLFVQNQASQHFKKTRGSNQGVESIFLGMKTGDDPKDHIPKEDVKDRLIEADEEIKAEFEQCRQDLHEQAIENAQDFNMSLANLTEAIHFACVKMEKEIKHMMDKQADKEIEMLRNATMNITKKLREIGDDVDDTVESNIRLRMLWLRVKIAKDTEELGIVQSQADALEVQIPPPESICEMYLECSMCLANPKCGWCTRENMCVEGDEVAPLHYVCLQYDFSVCRGESCNMNIDCDTCITNELCGWCDANHMCLERTPTFNGCAEGWYNKGTGNEICPAAQPSQEDLEKAQALKDQLELRRADVESEIDQFSPKQKKDREIRAKLIKLQQRALDLTRKIESNQKELDHLTGLMEEYEACVELSVKTHNRKVRYYRKKHEAELEAEKEQEELEAAEQQNAEGGSAQQGNPTPQF